VSQSGRRFVPLRPQPAAVITRTMQRCPPEIWSRIIDNMRDHWSYLEYRSIGNIALVCRSMTPIAQAELFRHICLHANKPCVEKFAETVHHNSRLLSYIYHLEVAHGEKGEDISQWLSYPAGLQAHLFASFSNITRLSLLGIKLSKIETEAQITCIFLNFTSLQSLTVDRCQFFKVAHIYTLLSCFRFSLRHLDMSHASFTNDQKSVVSAPQPDTLGLLAASPYDFSNTSLELSSLEMRGDTRYLWTWLLRSGTAKRMSHLDIQPRKEDIDALIALSGTFEGLTSLQLDMFGPLHSRMWLEVSWDGKLVIASCRPNVC
jgi:hypothetical protein